VPAPLRKTLSKRLFVKRLVVEGFEGGKGNAEARGGEEKRNGVC